MALRDQTYLRIVLYEGLDATPFEADSRFQVVSRLLNQGFAVTHVGEGGRTAPPDDVPVLVLGRFGEAVQPLAAAARAEHVRFHDVSGVSDDGVVAVVESTRAETRAVQHGGWKPWFPVIDYDRCTNCMQCLSFCLFGVYGADREG